MANPYLPGWEYIPDGEPRVFGDRVYIYGSHDKPHEEIFCDTKMKVWSASVDDLEHWVCHGDMFHTCDDRDHKSDTPWTDHHIFAPDVVYKDGKYYLYCYIEWSVGCVAVSDRPEGPFKVLGQYDTTAQVKYMEEHRELYDVPHKERPNVEKDEETGTEWEIAMGDMQGRIFIDPGVLVDDDGRVYCYCGYLHSFMVELDPNDMRTVIPGSYIKDIIPVATPFRFFEACSPRKIDGVYYLIYSSRECPQLVYATSDKPQGPFTYQGVLIDAGKDYPGGNDHGSLCKIKDQWYIFYHKMTNGTIMSRKGCVEKIFRNPDGTFKQAEMTSHGGFLSALRPFEVTEAEAACVLTGGCFITELDVFTRPISNVCGGCVIGYKTFDFGENECGNSLKLMIKQIGVGQKGFINVCFDDPESEPVAKVEISPVTTVLEAIIPPIKGRHDLYFKIETGRTSWMAYAFDNRELCKIEKFVFCK